MLNQRIIERKFKKVSLQSQTPLSSKCSQIRLRSTQTSLRRKTTKRSNTRVLSHASAGEASSTCLLIPRSPTNDAHSDQSVMMRPVNTGSNMAQTHGTNMPHTWHKHMAQTHGTNMAQTWHKHGTNMAQTWHKHLEAAVTNQCLIN